MSYSPKIKEELVRKLYQFKHSTTGKLPMTKLVNKAVEEYLERKNQLGKEKYFETDQNSGSGPDRIAGSNKS